MSWNDQDIDRLFRAALEEQNFVYDPIFFSDIERQLPVKRSIKTFFGWTTDLVIVMICSILFYVRISDGTAGKQTQWYFHPLILGEKQVLKSTQHNDSHKNSIQPKTIDLRNEQTQHQASMATCVRDNGSLNILTSNKTQVDLSDSISSRAMALETLTLEAISLSHSQNIQQDIFGNTKKSRIIWSLQLRSGVQQAWTNEGFGNHYNNIAGMNIDLELQRGSWSVDMGLLFQWNNLSNLEIRERTKIYGFGYSTYDNAYSFKGVATIGAPVHVNYSFGKHSFGTGIDFGRNLFATIQRVQSMNGEVFRTTRGKTDVSLLNKNSCQIDANYSFHLNEHSSVGACFSYQLLNPLTSDRFEGSYIHHPLSLEFSVKTILGK